MRELLRNPWDLVIAHPPCTYLTVARGFPIDNDDVQLEALEFFIDCQNANAPRVAVENPLPYKFVRAIVGQHSQTVHPYHFGDMYLKRTCWWLRGLPPLMASALAGEDGTLPALMPATTINPKRTYAKGALWGAGTELRSEFHPCMAAAMAKQWGCFL